jgi:hypothetical protein
MPVRFLGTPADIRRAIHSISTGASRFDAAVAFVGSEWEELLAGYQGRLRLVCWLSNTATDPRAVSQLTQRRLTTVRQWDGMHAKVYLAPRIGAVVASANLSRAGLDTSGLTVRDEAGLQIPPGPVLSTIERWFGALWRDEGTRRIEGRDIREALRRFFPGRRPPPRLRPRARRLHTTLHRLADLVRDLDLNRDIQHALFREFDPTRVGRGEVRELVDQLVEWAGRPWIYEPLLTAPLPQLRRGFVILFDEGREVEERLAEVRREEFLERLGIASLSILLYWWRPVRYPPFNVRTDRFLRDFQLEERGVNAASPTTYRRWMAHADGIALDYRLPTRGHVDRMVWEHTRP